MSGRHSSLARFWLSERSLSVFLLLLVVDAFVVRPLIELQAMSGLLQPVVFSLVLVAGIGTTLRSRRITVLVSLLAVVSLVVRWASHVYPSPALVRADAASSLAWTIVLAALVLVQVYRPGPINMHRVQGAIAVYLLLAFVWAFAYRLVALGDPGAFSLPASGVERQHLLDRLVYFSLVTLTTVGYGDITPVSPLARSLATLEALTGQLFPAILLARLVSLELYHRQQRGQ